MGTETIFMCIQGPFFGGLGDHPEGHATTEELLLQAAKMLGVDRSALQLEQEVGPGEICFNAEMPEGYYDEHEDGEELDSDGYRLSWEPA